MYRDILKTHLIAEEGDKDYLYDDANSKRVVPGSVIVGKVTGGIGYNFTDRGIPAAVKALLFDITVAEAEDIARRVFPSFDSLTDNRKACVCDLAFNMGETRLRGFSNMISAVNGGDYSRAAQEMLNSRWATQVGKRATTLSDMMRDG